MHTTKDTSFNTALAKLQAQAMRNVPNILKKKPTEQYLAYPRENTRDFDFSLSRHRDESSLIRYSKPKRDKEVEVLFLNQSDFVDIPMSAIATGEDTVTLVVDSVPQEAQVKEIVVDQSQIYQLASVPQDVSDPKIDSSDKFSNVHSQQQNEDKSHKTNRSFDTVRKFEERFSSKSDFMHEMKNQLQTLRPIGDRTSDIGGDGLGVNNNKSRTPRRVKFKPQNNTNRSHAVRNASSGAQTGHDINDGEVVIISDEDEPRSEEDASINRTNSLEVAENATPARPASPMMPVSVCRTCLKQVPPSTCQKLYDTGRYHRRAYDLRQKLFEVANFVDLQASLDPVVCTDCYQAINSAYAFRTQAKHVEDQIHSRRGRLLSVVDLKLMLEELEKERLELKKDLQDVRSRKGEDANLEKYLQKRKSIINQYMSQLEEDNPPPNEPQKSLPAGGNEDAPFQNSRPETPPPPALPSADHQIPIEMLENILANSQNGRTIIEIVNEDEEWDNEEFLPARSSVGEMEMAAPSQKSLEEVGTSLDVLFQNLEHEVQSLDMADLGLERSAPSLELTPEEAGSDVQTTSSNVEWTTSGASTCYSGTNDESRPSTENMRPPDSKLTSAVPSAESSSVVSLDEVIRTLEPLTMPEIELVPSGKSSISNLKYLVSSGESTTATLDSSVVSMDCSTSESASTRNSSANVTRALTMDAFLKIRQEKFKKLVRADPRDGGKSELVQAAPKAISNMLNDLDEEKIRRSEDAYNYLFHLNEDRKKKPLVPSTWDLFDAEHDTYFKNLRGDAGCFMARKWRRFSHRTPDDGNPPYLCEVCGKFFSDRPKLRQHANRHRGLDVTICSYCGMQVKSCRLGRHVLTQHKSAFRCDECGKKFHQRSLLENHVSIEHAQPSVRCQCQVCGVMLKKNSLGLHMRRHNGTFCDVCRKVFPDHASWYAHRKAHFKTQVYTCPVCSKPIKSRYNLKRHMKSFHEGQDSECCPLCGKFLSKRERLSRHMKFKHGWKPRTKRRTRKRAVQDPEEEEIRQATDFIAGDPHQTEDDGLMPEMPADLVYDDILNTPMDVEEIVVPYGTVDELFSVN